MNLESTFEGIIANAERRSKDLNDVNDDVYIKDGLKYCKRCNTARQTVISLFGKEKTVHCICKCQKEALDKEEEDRKQREKLERISRLRSNGIHDVNIRNWTFENADDSHPKLMSLAKRYYTKWDEAHKNNIGLLFFGNVGTGKTYLAACIANALINDGIPVLMTNFTKLINDLSGFKEDDKNAYINSLNNYELLIIDDLGVERQSDYALEQVFNVIDGRYKNGQPLIVTTNLSVEDLKNPSDMKFKRIYDRILEMTIPVKVDGVSRREQLHKDKLQLARELFAE